MVLRIKEIIYCAAKRAGDIAKPARERSGLARFPLSDSGPVDVQMRRQFTLRQACSNTCLTDVMQPNHLVSVLLGFLTAIVAFYHS